MRRGRGRFGIRGATVTLVTSGFSEGPPQALVRYLDERGAAEVIVVTHPLVAEDDARHAVEVYVRGRRRSTRTRRLPNRPPLTYVFDPFFPLVPSRTDVWIGFNCLATAQGLIWRRLGRVGRVVHWSIDFVPRRFGSRPLTRIYESLDAWCCASADGHVELSAVAAAGRAAQYNRPNRATVIPMGSWTDESPTTSIDAWRRRRVVFLGHLVERMGVEVLLDAGSRCSRCRGVVVGIDVVGGGPLIGQLRDRAAEAGVDDLVTFHGFVADFAEVQRILAAACVAVAPYEESEDSFTRYADPGKLKAYLGAGLPILLTDVPPNAGELAEAGVAQLLPASADEFATAIEHLLDDGTSWERRHQASLVWRRRFDWAALFDEGLPAIGIDR